MKPTVNHVGTYVEALPSEHQDTYRVAENSDRYEEGDENGSFPRGLQEEKGRDKAGYEKH